MDWDRESFATDTADGRALLKQRAAADKGAVDRAMTAALFAIFNRMVSRVQTLSAEAERSLPPPKGG